MVFAAHPERQLAVAEILNVSDLVAVGMVRRSVVTVSLLSGLAGSHGQWLDGGAGWSTFYRWACMAVEGVSLGSSTAPLASPTKAEAEALGKLIRQMTKAVVSEHGCFGVASEIGTLSAEGGVVCDIPGRGEVGLSPSIG